MPDQLERQAAALVLTLLFLYGFVQLIGDSASLVLVAVVGIGIFNIFLLFINHQV